MCCGGEADKKKDLNLSPCIRILPPPLLTLHRSLPLPLEFFLHFHICARLVSSLVLAFSTSRSSASEVNNCKNAEGMIYGEGDIYYSRPPCLSPATNESFWTDSIVIQTLLMLVFLTISPSSFLFSHASLLFLYTCTIQTPIWLHKTVNAYIVFCEADSKVSVSLPDEILRSIWPVSD